MPDPYLVPLDEPPLRLTPPFDQRDPSLFRQGWENAETHRNRLRQRRTRTLLDALAAVELSEYERHCLTWVAAWEVHVVATIAVLIRRAYRAGVRAGENANCNHQCNQETQTVPR